ILDVLLENGVTEKKPHSSSLEEHEAEKLRAHLRGGSEASVTNKPARPLRDGDEIMIKNDLSHISKADDVLMAISNKHQPPPTAPPAAPIAAGPPQPQAPAASRPTAPTRPQAPPPRMIVPQTGPRPVYKAPIRPAASSGAAARPAPGRPVPGQPIFQRPRPGAPSQRPSLRPGERRPMHPTR